MGRPRPPDESRAVAKAVGRQLRALRLERGMTQEQFAAAAGFHRTQAGFLERGESTPGIFTLIQAARVLDATASDILRDAGY